jgi:ech hydrogenase subunit D
VESLVGEVARARAEGCRFVTVTCVELDASSVDLLYHFDLGLDLRHLRLTVPKTTLVPSISSLFFAAFLVENEIQDLFGLRFQGLAIDYGRTLYFDEEVKTAPFCRYRVKGEGREGEEKTP